MKLLVLISAALSLADALYTPLNGLSPNHGINLKPRGKGNDALTEAKGGPRGGPRRNGIAPGKKDWDKEDVAQVRQVLDDNNRQTRSKGEVYESFSRPKNKNGWTDDERTNIAKIYYGPKSQPTSDHLRYRIAHDEDEKDRVWVPRPDTEAGRKATEDQRRESQRGLPKKKGAVLEEKPAAGVIHHDGEQASVVWDTEKSQNREGIMTSQAYDRVRQRGYDSNGNWKKGGVMFIPNSDVRNYDKPLVGWKNVPGYPDPKYDMEDLTKYRAGRTQRSSNKRPKYSSRSLSNTLLKRNKRSPPNLKMKRGGVETIAGIEATTTTQTPSTGNTTNSQVDFQIYLDAWDMIQANATDVIWPFIDDMLYGTNSSLVYMAAWSILSDLLYMPTSFIGPFHHGFTSMDWDEAQWRNDSSISNATLWNMYRTNDVLLTLYTTAWEGSVAALNATGYLDDLAFLSNYIDVQDTQNVSLPESWTSVEYSESKYQGYADFFLSFNSTVPSDQVSVPTNTTGYALVSGAPMPLSSSSEWDTGAPWLNGTSAPSGSLPLPTGWTVVGKHKRGEWRA